MIPVQILISAPYSNNLSMTTLHFVGSLVQNLKPFLKKKNFKNINLARITRIQRELSILFEINEYMKWKQTNYIKNLLFFLTAVSGRMESLFFISAESFTMKIS